MDQADKGTARKVFSENLQKLRAGRNLTQKQLAEILATSTSSVAMWESAKRETDFETLCRIADIFDVTVDYLLGRVSSEQHNKKLVMENGEVVGYLVLY